MRGGAYAPNLAVGFEGRKGMGMGSDELLGFHGWSPCTWTAIRELCENLGVIWLDFTAGGGTIHSGVGFRRN